MLALSAGILTADGNFFKQPHSRRGDPSTEYERRGHWDRRRRCQRHFSKEVVQMVS